MNHFYQDLCKPGESMFTYPKLYKEAIENCSQNGIVVEVGAWLGQSLAFLTVEAINSNKNIQVVGVDFFSGNVLNTEQSNFNQWDLFKQNLNPVWDKIVVIKHLSHEAARYFTGVDFVFIDADHSLQAVRRDLIAWWPRVCIGGIMAGHDYYYPPVRQAVDEFSQFVGLPYIVQEECWKFKKE